MTLQAKKITHASICSGIGGFDLSAEWMGWENKFHCEIDDFCRIYLDYYWPNSQSYKNTYDTDYSIWKNKITVLTAGFPCQPFSTAGKRKGNQDDRYLWDEVLRAIREIQPAVFVGENVAGIASMANEPTIWEKLFPTLESYTNLGGAYRRYRGRKRESGLAEKICSDLEKEGYEVQTFNIPACGVKAPHERKRIWFIAYSDNNRHQTRSKEIRKENGISKINRKEMVTRKFNVADISPTIANANNGIGSKHGLRSGRQMSENGTKRNGIVAHSERQRQPGPRRSKESRHKKAHGEWEASWTNDDGRWPTQSPICSGNDGFSGKLAGYTSAKLRESQIKAYGNAIVPQVAFEIFKGI